MKTQLPAGLVDKNIELFEHDHQLKFLFSGSVFKMPKLSLEAREIALQDMLSNHKAYSMICAWGYIGEEKLNKYLACRCGGFDTVPDINIETKTLNAEYWNCPKRGFCDGSGIVCTMPIGPGGKLSHRELEAINAIMDGTPMKVACQKINVRFNTFRAYLKSAYKKLGVHSNIEALSKIQ